MDVMAFVKSTPQGKLMLVFLLVAAITFSQSLVNGQQRRHAQELRPGFRHMQAVLPPGAPGLPSNVAALTWQQLFLTAPPLDANLTCSPAIQENALRGLYDSTGGPHWINTWNTSTTNCILNGTVQPNYCCWYGVSCCLFPGACGASLDRSACDCAHVGMVTQIRLTRNNMTGELPGNLLAWLNCELNFVDFSFNNMSGIINDTVELLQNIRTLALGNNNFSGSLPAVFKKLPKLQVLDLTNNNLVGQIPGDLCNDFNNSSLTDLLLASNNFSGSFNITACNNLVALDVTRNSLTGSLPNFVGYSMLHIARMGRNQFSGSLPPSVDGAPLLMDFDLSSNNLNGTIPEALSRLRLLAYLRLNLNYLTGTIPPKLFANLGSMVRMNLARNNLTGSIPEVNPDLGTLVLMDLSNNSLIGTIPASFKAFAVPSISVSLQQNLLSCCGIGPVTDASALTMTIPSQAYAGMNYTLAANVQTLLPDFLAFSSYPIPVPPDRFGNATHMMCPDVIASNKNIASAEISWNIDPSYYLFHNCVCESGFELQNVTQPNRVWHFVCQPINLAWYVKNPWVLPVVVVGTTMVIIAILFLLCYRKGAKPAFLQQYVNMRKRLKGEPKDGMITVVTTDIEGYSELMKREPELMGKGLRIHNYCIDKARWQFFGYTMEQEGDSFILAFYDPFDAVAFCLQAQLLLQRVEWPEKLLNPAGGAERTRKGSMLTQALGHVGRLLTREKTSDRPLGSPAPTRTSSNDSGTPSGDPPTSGGSRNFRNLLGLRSPNPGPIPEEHPVPSSIASPGISMQLQEQHTSGVSTAGGISSQGLPSGSMPSMPSTLRCLAPQSGVAYGMPQNGMLYGPQSGMGYGTQNDMSYSPANEGTGVRMHSGGASGFQARPNVFNGLRVRMGIATGKLDKAATLRSSPIMERSKVVSDAAAGGQVLMDGQTFREVKARLVELGAVDHNGLSVDKMNLSKPTLMSAMCGRVTKGHGQDEAEIAVVLDMGQYVHAMASKAATYFSNAFSTVQATQVGPTGPPSVGSHSAFPSGKAGLEQAAKEAVAAVEGPLTGNIDTSAQRLHLFQIVSPALVERAHHFGSNLALKDEWICVDPPYFSAPGAAAAALGLDTSSVIPPITMVFCMVDGAKDWKPLSDKAKRSQVQKIMRDVLINTLMAVKGGYMCRLQEDEFKYMVAFPEPEDAAKWCLIMQDALMWQEWPDWLLKQEKAKIETDDRGITVFRGPRLRAGLCHGIPRAIVPDHMGRADYHGASINSAARYMDAAAHGGQVVCEHDTAMTMINHWNSTSRLPPILSPEDPTPHPVSIDDAGVAALSGATAAPVAGGEISSSPFLATALATAPVSPGDGGSISMQATPSDPEPPTPSANRPATGRAGLGREYTLPQPPINPASEWATSGPPAATDPADSFSAHVQSPFRPRSDAVSTGNTDLVSISSLDLAAALRQTSQDDLAWRVNPAQQEAGTSEGGDWDDKGPLSLNVTGLPEASDGSEPGPRNPPRSATTPGAIDMKTSDANEAGPASSSVSASGTTPTAMANVRRTGSPSRHSEGQVNMRGLSPTARSGLGLRGVFPRPSNLSITSNAWQPDSPQGPGPPRVPSEIFPAPRIPSDASALRVPPAAATSGILRKGNAGSAPDMGAARPPKPSVRITLPNSPGPGATAEEPDRTTATTMAGRSSSSTADRTTRGMVSMVSHGSGAMTYRTAITALKLGGFMYKGNPDEVHMVQLLLESHLGRRFPEDPPKGKGGRTSIESGLAGVAPIVEMPNIARRYFWAWRARNETPIVPSTPRGGSAIKGWAVNILMASRSQSQRRSEDAFGGERPSDMRTSTLSTVQSARNIRNQFMTLVRMGSRLPPRAGLGYPDNHSRPTSEGDPAHTDELRTTDSAPPLLRPEGSGAAHPRTSHASASSGEEYGGTTTAATTARLAGNGGTVAGLRSDSISSFIAAAEEEILAQEQQESRDRGIIAERIRDGVDMV